MYIYGNENVNKASILKELEVLPYFTNEAVSQIANKNDEYINIALHRWTKANKVVRLKKGFYLDKAFFDKNINKVGFLETMSSLINSNSYVSLEYVLNKHGVFTEPVYSVTCITTKKTNTIKTDFAVFDYKNILEKLFLGYEIKDFNGIKYSEATLEKALFDYLYLKRLPLSPKLDLAEYLRLNLFVFNKNQINGFKSYIKRAKSRKMALILKNFERFVWKD